MSLLGAVWQLEDIEDVEGFVAAFARGVTRLQWWERDDLVAYLLGTVWELHERWDRAETPSFQKYAGYVLRLRVIDHVRKERGRTTWKFREHTYRRERPHVLSLDHDPGNGGLGATLAARSGDPQNDRDPDLCRLLSGRDRQRARDYEALGLEPPRRAPRRTRHEF